MITNFLIFQWNYCFELINNDYSAAGFNCSGKMGYEIMEWERNKLKRKVPNKGWNIKAVWKIILFRADYWAWVTKQLPIKKNTAE
jgi:hypothetical protein